MGWGALLIQVEKCSMFFVRKGFSSGVLFTLVRLSLPSPSPLTLYVIGEAQEKALLERAGVQATGAYFQ